jgi:hypothetical protein
MASLAAYKCSLSKKAGALYTPEEPSPMTLPVSITLKSDPAWDERGSGVGRREKAVSARVGKQRNVKALRSIEFLISSNKLQQP